MVLVFATRKISQFVASKYVRYAYGYLGYTDAILKAVKSCSRVYLEAYTSILMVQKERLVSPSLDVN